MYVGEFVEGTLLYMAPEMLREKLFAFKGDIFSFGMTLWEMLMRQQPYSGPKHRKLNKPQFEEIRERGEVTIVVRTHTNMLQPVRHFLNFRLRFVCVCSCLVN
jgi:serine/threonine protein kinase